MWLTAALGVDVTGPSLPVCPRVATILVLSNSSFKVDFKSQSARRQLRYRTNMCCTGTSADHLYLLLSCLNHHGTGCATGPTRVVLAPLLLTASATHCLWNVLVPSYQFESLVLTGLAPEIQDEPPEKRLHLWRS